MAATRPTSIEALAICIAIALAFWGYWTLFPDLTAGAVGNDALFLADGARRLAAGQVPHVDFSSPTGVLPYLTFFWAERAFPQFSAYIGAHLIGFLLLAPILAAAMTRMPNRAMALALAMLVSIAALLPFNVGGGDGYGIALYASYNRLGTALTLAYLAWLFRADSRPGWRGGVLVAYALLLAFFLKIVLVGVILAPMAVLALLNRHWRLPALIGLALTSAVLLTVELSGGWVSAYIADIRAMSAINARKAPYFLASFLFKTFVMQVLTGTLMLWLLIERWQAAGHGKPLVALVAIAQPLAMLAAVGALSFAESQATGGLEFAGALGLLFAPGLLGTPAQLRRVSIMAAAAGLIAGPLVVGAFQNSMAVLLKRQGATVAVDRASRYLPHMVVPEPMLRKALADAALWEHGGEIRDMLEAAGADTVNRSAPDLYLLQWATVDTAIVQLTEQERAKLGAVATLGNVDLFGLALGAEPVRGIKIVHDIGRTILPLDAAQARRYLAGADTVFRPTCIIGEAPGFERMSGWFVDVLRAEFSERRLTPCWTMHRRHPRK
jgi:hypothetical protein